MPGFHIATTSVRVSVSGGDRWTNNCSVCRQVAPAAGRPSSGDGCWPVWSRCRSADGCRSTAATRACTAVTSVWWAPSFSASGRLPVGGRTARPAASTADGRLGHSAQSSSASGPPARSSSWKESPVRSSSTRKVRGQRSYESERQSSLARKFLTWSCWIMKTLTGTTRTREHQVQSFSAKGRQDPSFSENEFRDQSSSVKELWAPSFSEREDPATSIPTEGRPNWNLTGFDGVN